MNGMSVALTVGLFVFAQGLKSRLEQVGLMPIDQKPRVERSDPAPTKAAGTFFVAKQSSSQTWNLFPE